MIAVDNATIPDKNISFTPLAKGSFSANGGVMTGVKKGDTIEVNLQLYINPNTGYDHEGWCDLVVNGNTIRSARLVPTYRSSAPSTVMFGAYNGFFTADKDNPSYSFVGHEGSIDGQTGGIWKVVR